MVGFFSTVIMAALLGAASFGAGMLPLSFAFSSEYACFSQRRPVHNAHPAESALAALSSFGTGLLLGAALGVVIPEYVLY